MKQNERSIKRKIHCTKCLHKEIGEISYQQLNNTPEITRTESSKYTQEEYNTLAKLTKGQRTSIQINKIRNEEGDITTEIEEIKKKKSS